MASFYKRKDSPFYWVKFQKPDGTWGGKASTVRTDALGAIRSIKQFVAEHTQRELHHSDTASAHRFDSWVPSFLAQRHADPTTLRRYMNAWSALATYFGHRGIISPSQVKHKLCTDYPAFRTNPPDKLLRPAAHNTALLELKVLSGIMQEAVRRDFIQASPCVRLGIKKEPPKPKFEISATESEIIESALATREPWMRDCWLIAMRQGCRFAETAVPLSQIDTKQMTITFRIKGGREHTAPLHRDLLPLVAKARQERRKALVALPQYGGKQWWHFFRQIGLPHLCFHCTRVTVITKLARSGKYTAEMTMRYVGHDSETVHAIYRKFKPSDVAHLGAALSTPIAETADSPTARPKPTRRKPSRPASETQPTSSV